MDDEMLEYGTIVEDNVNWEMLDYSRCIYDKYWYKERFPLFEMEICELLAEQCKIKVSNKKCLTDKEIKDKLTVRMK